MGEELQKAGINTPASKKSSETFRRSTKGSPFEDETNSLPAFGNPKFYQDPEEEEVDEEGKVVSGREKHLANVVKELLKEESLAGQVNKIEPLPPQSLGQDQDQDDNAVLLSAAAGPHLPQPRPLPGGPAPVLPLPAAHRPLGRPAPGPV